ncbi:GNAT family N-acetyltransferase [Spirochaetota bacterium]
MEIRKAGIGDFENIKKIKIASKRSEAKFNRTIKPVSKSKTLYYMYLKKDLTGKDRIVYIAIDGNKVIGMITGRTYKSIPLRKVPRMGHVSNLYIMPSYRRRGIGEVLVKMLLKWFRKNSIKDVRLGVFTLNKAAIQIFSKLKFQKHILEMKISP